MGFNKTDNTIYVGDANGASKLVGAPLPLGVQYGGTGSTTAAAARSALGAAALSHTHTLSQLSDWPGIETTLSGETNKLVTSQAIQWAIPKLVDSDRIEWNSAQGANGQDEYWPKTVVADSLNATLSISEGGTGATSAADALSNLGGISLTLLWRTANSGAAFASQNLWLELSAYNFLLLIFGISTTYQYTMPPVLMAKNNVGVATGAWGDTGNTFHRQFKNIDNQLWFDKGYYGGQADNNAVIPYLVYGVKGVPN